MSRYVPPHRKREIDPEKLTDGTSELYQQEEWRALSRTITGIVNRVNSSNLKMCATELFRENLIRGRGLLVRSLLRLQQTDMELTSVLASLASRINKEFPDVIFLLCKRIVEAWKRAFRRKDWMRMESLSRFLCWLYLFRVVEVDVLYQMILAHLMSESRSDDNIDQAAKVFRETFRAMSVRTRKEFHEQVLTPFRDLLAMDDEEMRLSTRSQAVLESCLKAVQQWERVKDEEAIIPEHLILFDLDEQTTRALDLDEHYDTEDNLDRYAFDPQFVEHEAAYEVARCAILGDQWQMELLEQAAAVEDEMEEAEEVEQGHMDSHSSLIPSPQGGVEEEKMALDASKTLLSEEERLVRRDVYMAMRSSVRADEAVHKILKQMRPQTERSVCFMVIEGCCEERSYRRLYGMTAERLCKSNARFQSFFANAFRERYTHANSLSVKQIEYTCNVFTHLLRTDAVYWAKCLCVMDILQNDESQRLFIQYLFKGLADEMGMPSFLARLHSERELQTHISKLFPVDADEPSLELAVNLYAAMGLSAVTTIMRKKLDEHRRSRKRERERSELEYV